MPHGTGWEWRLLIQTQNYERILLDAQQLLRDAELGGLPGEWLRHNDRMEVLERRLTSGTLTSHDDIVTWFADGLHQMRYVTIS